MSTYKKVLFVGSPQYFGGTLVIAEACRTFRLLGYNAKVLKVADLPRRYISPRKFPFWVINQNLRYEFHKIKYKVLSYCFPSVKRWRKFRTIVEATDLKGIKIKKSPFLNRNKTIVIYPECIYGNPLCAKDTVRWLLYHYQFEGDRNAYTVSDLFVAYRDVFNSPRLNPSGFIYKISHFDSALYRQYNFGERKGSCYILRKGRNRPDVPEVFDGPVYDNDIDQKTLVDIFNQCKYCYSYDTQTFYSSIAAICGCISIVVLEPGKTESDYLSANENHYGVAYGNTSEQIEYAIATRSKLAKELNFDQINIEQTQKFIELLECRFGRLSRLH